MVIGMHDTKILHETGKDPLYKTWHTSRRPVFMYLYSDGGSIVTRDEMYPIKKGTLVLILPGTYHYTIPDDPKTYDRSKIIPSVRKFTKLAGILRENSDYRDVFERPVVYAPIAPEEQETVDLLFTEAVLCENTDKEEPFFLSCLLRLIHYLKKYTTHTTNSNLGFMGKAIQFINENISTELNIDRICSAINVSKYHFCRQFKSSTGLTVMQYILNTRIIMAKSELKRTKMPVTEISEHCGFSSVSYFCRVFHQQTGYSPLQYRKKKT